MALQTGRTCAALGLALCWLIAPAEVLTAADGPSDPEPTASEIAAVGGMRSLGIKCQTGSGTLGSVVVEVNFECLDRESTQVALGLLSRLPHLHKLDLRGGKLQPVDLELVGKLATVNELILRYVEVDGRAIDQLARLPKLDQLWLEDPVLPEDLGSFAKLKALTTLTLAIHRAGGTVPPAALRSLKELPKLTTLRLRHTHINAAGVAALADLTNLTSLSLYNTHNLTDSALEPLEKAAHLKSLDVSACPKLGNKAINVLGKMKSLEHLDIRNNGINEAGARKLRKLLPNCRIEHF